MEKEKVRDILSDSLGGLPFDLCSEELVQIITDLCDELELCGRDVQVVLRDTARLATAKPGRVDA